MAASGLHPIFEGVKLALFDKDGTLTHCDKCFGPYIEELMTKLAALGYVKDHARFMHALGYYPATKEFALDSIMVRGSNDGVRRAAAKEAFTQSQIDAVDADGAQNGTGETSGDRAYTNFEATFLQHTIEQAVWTVDLHKHLTTDTLELCTVRSAAPHGPSREEVEAGKIMFFGVFDALRANTIAVGIATSDDRHITEHTLRIIGLDLASSPGGVMHEHAMSCGDDAIENKPSPAGLLRACTHFGVSPVATIMVGDSFTDMQAGLQAGAKCLFVESGGLTFADLEIWVDSFNNKNESIGQLTSKVTVVRLSSREDSNSRQTQERDLMGEVGLDGVGQVVYVMQDIGDICMRYAELV